MHLITIIRFSTLSALICVLWSMWFSRWFVQVAVLMRTLRKCVGYFTLAGAANGLDVAGVFLLQLGNLEPQCNTDQQLSISSTDQWSLVVKSAELRGTGKVCACLLAVYTLQLLNKTQRPMHLLSNQNQSDCNMRIKVIQINSSSEDWIICCLFVAYSVCSM